MHVVAVGRVELAVLGAVINRRPVVGVAVDVEIGALGRRIVAHDLGERARLVVAAAAVVNLVGNLDAVGAAPEGVGLGDRHPLRAPGERHAQLRGAAEAIVGAVARVLRVLVRVRAGAGSGEPGLQLVKRQRRVVVLQAHGRGLALHLRIGRQVDARERAPAQADVHVEHVGVYVDRRGGLTLALAGRRGGRRGTGVAGTAVLVPLALCAPAGSWFLRSVAGAAGAPATGGTSGLCGAGP